MLILFDNFFKLFNGTFEYILKTYNLEALCKRVEHFYTSVSIFCLHKEPIIIINMQACCSVNIVLLLCGELSYNVFLQIIYYYFAGQEKFESIDSIFESIIKK